MAYVCGARADTGSCTCVDDKACDRLARQECPWRTLAEAEKPPTAAKPLFPHDSAARKAIPIVSGVLNYFPAALVEVAKVSKAGNDKHNPGQPLHHNRGKSLDHIDSAVRHAMEFEADNDTIDPDTGCSVLASAAWRILARLQLHLETRGAPLAPGAKKP